MPRPKKAGTPKGIQSTKKYQVNLSLSMNTYEVLHRMARDQRRPMTSMARLILEDATGTAPE